MYYNLNSVDLLTEVEAQYQEVQAWNDYTLEYEWLPLTQVTEVNGNFYV